jgi:Sec-independent protein translocase protein TatA
MKLSKLSIAFLMLSACLAVNVSTANAQLGGIVKKTKSKVKDAENKMKTVPKPENQNSGANQTSANSNDDDSDARAENAKKLAKAAGMPKAANTDAALNKLLFQAADDTRLIPRKVVVVDKDWFITTGARNEKVRRIFAVIGRTLDDGSGKCGKQMAQFDQDWKADKNAWGLIYVQNVGEITPIACGAIGK